MRKKAQKDLQEHEKIMKRFGDLSW